MLQWIPTVWLGVIAIRYCLTANATLHASNSSFDWTWLYVWIGFLLMLTLSAVLLKRSVMKAIWLILGIALALIILILSRSLLPALIAVALLVVSAGIGEFVFQRLRLSSTSLVERLVMTVPVGIGVLALGQLLLGIAGLFNPVASWAMILVLGLPATSGLTRLFALRFEPGPGKHSWLSIPIGYVFLLNLTWAASPEIQFDPLNVHLAVPRLYLEHGALVDLSYFFHSYFAHLLDMVFGLCLALGGPLVAKFLVLSCGALAAAGVYAIGRALFNEEAGRWASLIFYTTPLVVWLSGTAYLDLALGLFILASVLAVIRWYEKPDWGWIAVSGWIAGVAMGTKAVAVTTLAVLPIVAVWHSRRVRLFACFLIPLLVVALPWFLVVYAETGNPFFPYMNAVFRSPQWPFENPIFNTRDFGIGTSAAALVRLPFRFTWNTDVFGELLPRGGVGIGLLLAFPLALIFLWRGRPAQRLVLAVIGVHITVWTLTFQYARYMIPVLPLLVVTGCAVFLDDSLGFRRLNRVLLFCGVFAQVSMAPVLFWSIPERFPVRRALGLETEEDFLSRALPGYKAARALNNVVQPQDKILGVAVENLRFYLKGPLYTRAELDLDRPPYELGNAGKGADLAAWHMQHGFRYVIAPQSVLRDPPSYQPFLQPRFLSEFGQQLYGDEIAAVFKISAPSRQPDPKPRFTSANDAAVDNVVVQPLTVRSNETYTVTFIGRNLTDSTWFDVRIKSPVSSEASVDLNWQQGPSAAHNVPPGTAIGDWIIAGVRAHQNETDRSSVFAPVSATIRVTSK